MKLTYYGTAAAEGWPGMFCACESCAKAKKAGGRNIRTRSQALVDNQILIDFPADTYMHVLYMGLDLKNIKTCIITHSHSDHLYERDFEMRCKLMAHLDQESLLTVYGTEPAGVMTDHIIETYHLQEESRVKYQYIIPYKPFVVEGYRITPLKANHDPASSPVIYMIDNGDKTILYANDTGYFTEDTWNYLNEEKPFLDLVSLDCTLGIEECRDGHMGLSVCNEVKERLIKMNCADEQTIFIVNHFSHNGKLIYDELVPVAKECGFLVSYDGMVVEI